MTDEPDISPASDEAGPATAKKDAKDAADAENVQSLTDFFDQMDRAAFKRALTNRDAHRARTGKPSKSERR